MEDKYLNLSVSIFLGVVISLIITSIIMDAIGFGRNQVPIFILYVVWLAITNLIVSLIYYLMKKIGGS